MAYEDPITTSGDKNTALLAMSVDKPKPEQPEVLALLRRSRRLGVPVFNGAFIDIPHIASLELEECLLAEQEHREMKLANIELQAINAKLQAKAANT